MQQKIAEYFSSLTKSCLNFNTNLPATAEEFDSLDYISRLELCMKRPELYREFVQMSINKKNKGVKSF